MRKKRIIVKGSLDAVKPATNILNFSDIENSSDDNTKWHNAKSTMESNKRAKTEESSNQLEDQEKIYKHFF